MFKMLWWGVDETFEELFARHPQAHKFEGKHYDAFSTKIMWFEYSPDKTPRTIGLYGGRYAVIVNPGECVLWA